MRRSGLFLKYAIPLIVLTSGGLVLSSVVDGYFSYRENKAALSRIQREKAATAAVRIEQFVREIEHQIAWIAHTSWGVGSVPVDQRRLDSLRLLRHVPAITEVSHLDPSGHEQLRVSRLAMDVIGSRQDYSQDPKFKQAIARKTYFSPVYFRKESEPYMTIALAGNAEDAGVIAAEANLKFIWDVVSSMRVGQGGYAYVVDGRGRLIAHPDISLVLQKTDLSALPQIRAANNASASGGGAAEAIVGLDRSGHEVLSAYAPIEPLGWLVFVDLPVQEAFAPIYASAMRTALLLLSGVIASVAASLVLVRRMVAPIKTVQAGAARIGAGELEHRIEVKTGDELEALANEFNGMAGRLQESYADLEKKVQDRTRDLRETLEQQTATAEILRVISRSPTDLQPVLDAIARSAGQLCDGWVFVYRYDGQALDVVTGHNLTPEIWAVVQQTQHGPPTRAYAAGRAVLDGVVVHIPDVTADPEYNYKSIFATGMRSVVSVPMLRHGKPVGAINVGRGESRAFSDREIELLKTFADQAVIAIENVRLFQELRTRTDELAQSVQRLRSLAEVGEAVNSTLDLEQVLATIVARAAQLSSADAGLVYELNERTGELLARATHGVPADTAEVLAVRPLMLAESIVGRAAAARAPVEIPDLTLDSAYTGRAREAADEAGFRALLAVPLIHEGRIIGGLAVSRRIPGEFPPEIVELLQTFAAQSTLAIQNARLFREIEHKSHEVEIASRHKSQFLANMSHELRTPLNAILGYTELIVDHIYGEVPERIGEVLDRVQKSARHLLGLINDVLDLSKIEAGQLTLAIAEYSFDDVIQSVTQAVESLAAEKRLQLTVNVAPGLPVGRGDVRRITQVLMNLVGNAIKFTDVGQVSVGVSLQNGAFMISVADTGPGIPESERERIFEEFQQADGSATRTKGGTGLGLAIARHIVQMHGGRIWVESVVGEGSVFWFTLPATTERHEAMQ